ncbi:hypothetical protein [Xanthomonas translucens]|uniref:hypothetical protein n=1 Tax=Xanthomonas campestris pv. translucens TaxID=343 RepID=UPI0003457E28|nr:hypothetical protein [Xanthomonas translucens]MBC3972443.1 hypothetical protein [Xanthomonas translucens pv. undulosa]MCT8270270.1 hypothetical protein [Xanthomonas translucens pv. undulosa]MCT8282437.1 hypothetical protein [Xanthomonas translucens pv. undulosa]MCT8317125.1 hypothetical protein [Xanthomonas translucens pv. undulosa]QEN92028.1 hypothetical protein F0H33_00270 [Xanthomonas translucens pv. undulosa]
MSFRRDAHLCTRSPPCNDRIQPQHEQGRGLEARLIEPELAQAYASLIGDARVDVYAALWRLQQELRREPSAKRVAGTPR